MKRPAPLPAVQDQIIPPCEGQNRRAAKSSPFVTRLSPTLLGRHQPVSYVPSEKPRKEPSALPRLFIRGHGGSIKLDLCGVGVGLSKAVFAHFVADDSLLSLHVCPGDIALVEPAVRRIHSGNLLLLNLEGRLVIRQLEKQKRFWVLHPVGQSSERPVVLIDQGIQGVVIGFVRLFNKLRPIRYEGTDANDSTGLEIATPARRRRTRAEPLENSRSRVRLARSLTNIRQFFASNQNGRTKMWLNEIDEAIRYIARPDKR